VRHTFATRLVMRGVDIRTVQELMGHKGISMTVRYSHLAPKHTLAAVELFADASTALSTDTRTSTGAPCKNRSQSLPRTKAFRCKMIESCAPVAQLDRAPDF